MSRYVDELYQSPGQPGLRAVLRGMLKLLFRGLIRPPVPFAVQALVLRLLTLGMPLASGVTRSVEQIAGRPCMWHRPAAGGNGRVLLEELEDRPGRHRRQCFDHNSSKLFRIFQLADYHALQLEEISLLVHF